MATPTTTPVIANPRFLDDENKGAMPKPVPNKLTKICETTEQKLHAAKNDELCEAWGPARSYPNEK